MTTGRPTLYSEEMETKARDYAINYADYGDMIPSIAGLAVHLGVNRSSLYAWRDAHEVFSDILSDMLSRQEKTLLNGGLGGDFNSGIAKLVLGKHGYHDKQDTNNKHELKADVNWVVDASGNDST